MFLFDDLIVGIACRPRLTTMHYPVEEMAQCATNLAIKLSDTSATPSKPTHLFIADLVERDSVKKHIGIVFLNLYTF
jgi:LacI family transcriptional regulator